MPETPLEGTDERTQREYAGERDMDRFWREAVPRAEPATRRWYIPLLLVLIVISIPWYFSEGHVGRVIAGFPVWIWIALGSAFGVALLTACAILRFWKDDGPDGE